MKDLTHSRLLSAAEAEKDKEKAGKNCKQKCQQMTNLTDVEKYCGDKTRLAIIES